MIRYIFLIVLLVGLAFADNPAVDVRLELRHRLDSVEVEKQARKRQGLGIEDLEAAAAELRDSLLNLRAHVPQAAAAGEPDKGGFALPWKIPYLEGLLSLKPRGAFDWIVAGTGLVAILSGLMLVVGIIAGRKKKPAARRKEKVVSRKVNLAPTGAFPAMPEFKTYDNTVDDNGTGAPPRPITPAAGQTYNFGGRMGGKKEPANIPTMRTDSAKDEEGPSPELQSLLENLRKAAPPPPAAQPAEPPPLVVNATEPASSVGDSNAGAPKLSGAGALADRLQWAPPSGGTGAGAPAFNELVTAASKSGLGELEISKRYQLSVDQVRLILRMSK